MADNLTPGNSGTSFKKEASANTSSGGSTLDALRARSSGKKVVTNDKKEKKKENVWRSLLIALGIALLIRGFLVEAFRIPTGSMKSTLLVGDYLFVNKLSYFLKSPKYIPFTKTEIPYFSLPIGDIERGDVVVFEYPGNQDEIVPREKNVNYIKRTIGLPGDEVMIRSKQVFVNGKPMENPEGMRYKDNPADSTAVQQRIFPRGAQWNQDWFGPIRVPKEGDKITITRDNIAQWEVFIAREGHRAQIGGNGMIHIDGVQDSVYEVKRDYLFMMGDNRDDSEDSRFWGFLPMENVVGEAMFIYWSWYRPPSDGSGDGYDAEEVQETDIRWERMFNIIR
jgi:signal peptidase I